MSKTVLIVDDTAFMRKMLGDMLKKNGYEVIGEAGNGVEAVEQYQELNPDIVTMDITMPEKNGIEALTDIIALNPEAVVIMCSAMGQQNMVQQALEAGAKDFIIKPFKPDRVLEAFTKSI
ncbi:response regulator [[Brevibacterium] frigoritolerans]|nr:response regulator [Peribacillus frigoritolerans]